MAAHHKSVRCLLEIKAYPWMDYVLPGDTWKGESVAKDRRELAIQMASAANPDGTSITASHRTWLREIGMKRATLFTRLDDLKENHLLPDKDGFTGERGTAVRKLDIPAWRKYVEAGISSPWPRVPKSNIREPKSNARLDPTVNRQSTEEQKQEQQQHQDLGNPENETSSQAAEDQNLKTASEAESKSSTPLNDETLGQHFLPNGCYPGFDVIAPGMDRGTKPWEEFDGKDDLYFICLDVIKEFADQPYHKNESEAFVMDAAMKRFNAKHGKVPPCWVRVMKDLRRAATNSENGQESNDGKATDTRKNVVSARCQY